LNVPNAAAQTFAIGAVLLLAACAATAPQPAAPPAPAPAALDPSYDWHVLVVVPFGSVLRDVPMTLHEVLLFRDEAQKAAPADELECYAVDDTRPRFVGRTPSEYLLCFKHDRLARIEAMVRLPGDEAARIFADACRLWMKNAQATTEECAGSDGGTTFVGHFENEADESAQLTLQLDAADAAGGASER
jgi:hypothetical protein